MKKYVMAIDQGTTSSRAIIFNKKAEIITSSQKESPRFSLNQVGLNMMLMQFGIQYNRLLQKHLSKVA